MKSVLLSLVAFVALGSQADTQIVYGQHETTVIKDTVNFPGYGEVAANKVCVSADQQTLHARVEERTERRCLESYVDRSDSTRPVVVCTKWETINVAAMDLVRFVNQKSRGCVRWHVDHTDSTRPVRTCVEYGEVVDSAPLSYEVIHYRLDDYRRERPTYTRENMKTCN